LRRQASVSEDTESTVRKDAQRKKKEQELANLYEGYYDKIARYIFIHINDRTEAEDLASEVFLKALNSLDSYQERGQPMHSWLFKIAHNLVVDHVRKMSKHQTMSLEELEVEVADTAANPDEIAESCLQTESLAMTLEQLSPPEREVIGLRFFAGLSAIEAGKILGKSPEAVRQMQYRALKSLRKALDKENWK
jgi:RNA polymerase sigma-70 factor (ECF subfamily)